MNIHNLSDEQLAKSITNFLYGDNGCYPLTLWIKIIPFIRQCVKDSIPSEEEIKKVILQWNSVIADDGLAEDMACAIYNLIERK